MSQPLTHPLHTIQKERAIILILAALQFLHILDFVIMMPLGPVFMESFKINSAAFGLLVSSYSISAGVFGLIGALFLDSYDRKLSLLVLFFGFSFGTLLCAFAPNYGFLLFARVVAGGFGGMIGATVLSIIGDIIPVFRRGTATGIVMSSFSIASVIGVPTGLKLANKFGWHFPFLSLAIAGFLILPIGYKVLPSIRYHLDSDVHPKQSQLKSLKQVIMKKDHIAPFIFMVFLMFGGFTVIPFLSPFLVSNVGLAINDLPYIYLFGGLFTFFTSWIIGKLSDKFGKLKIYQIITIIAVIPIVIVVTLTKTSLPLVLTFTTLFMIFVSGRMVPAFSMITSAVEPRIRGSFMSVNSAIQQIASGAASYVAGLILVQTADNQLVNYELVGMISVFSLLFSVYLAKKIKIAG
ncbi:MFS transporter [Leptospira bandrabouensis]|uniref:MFS transporter n=1 Tax=Leptospira bandrabouensis TaxID=2484903 RepID=UPI001EE89879|nr:MFS transporter [Leptospira bandrabouensis]MCG6144218.1 MFS transporter [Leptospira bandrabouensis]MCG6159879.1 MFS transporter [Leptospira bandrabouensis]MCG6163812.1 MFS transporter [Leptospira bandrabouensis]